jgi:probable HAF family extracellular repeat protein
MHHPGHAFVYDQYAETMTDIGTLPGYQHSVATSINNAGQVVGYAWLPENEDDPYRRAFLYDYRTNSLKDLNALIPEGSGWQLVDANDISDGGQIVGRGLINGEMHAYVLTPIR